MTSKMLAMVLLAVTGTAVPVVAAVSQGNSFSLRAEGETCEHEGHHYSAKATTKDASGIKEYWVCCKCHEHFLYEIDGSWTDAGVASGITDQNDDRYIPQITVSADDLKNMGFSNVTQNPDGTYNVGAYSGKEENVVIPEGVSGFNRVNTTTKHGAFDNDDTLVTVTIPSTMKNIEGASFYGCDNLQKVILSEGVEYIGTKNVTLMNNVGAVGGCTKLEEIIIPKSVIKIDAKAFSGSNTNLKIKCVADSKPSGFATGWNYKNRTGSSTAAYTTSWSYKG